MNELDPVALAEIAAGADPNFAAVTFGPFAEPLAPSMDDVARLAITIRVRRNVERSRQIRRARKLAPSRTAYDRAVRKAIQAQWARDPVYPITPPFRIGLDLAGGALGIGMVMFDRHHQIVDTSRLP